MNWRISWRLSSARSGDFEHFSMCWFVNISIPRAHHKFACGRNENQYQTIIYWEMCSTNTFSTRSISSRLFSRISCRLIRRSVMRLLIRDSSSHFGCTTSLGQAAFWISCRPQDITSSARSRSVLTNLLNSFASLIKQSTRATVFPSQIISDKVRRWPSKLDWKWVRESYQVIKDYEKD